MQSVLLLDSVRTLTLKHDRDPWIVAGCIIEQQLKNVLTKHNSRMNVLGNTAPASSSGTRGFFFGWIPRFSINPKIPTPQDSPFQRVNGVV